MTRKELIKILSAHSLELLQDWFPGGELRGDEYLALNPNRVDTSLGSFKININTCDWADFAVEGARGLDLLSLYKYIHPELDLSPGDVELRALVKAKGWTVSDTAVKPRTKRKPTADKSADQAKPIDSALVPPEYTPDLDEVVAVWEYRDSDSNLRFWVVRAETDKGKVTLPVSVKSDETYLWKLPIIEGGTPLYNGHRLTEGCSIVWGEGEKVADHLQSLYLDRIALTTQGGSSALLKSNLNPIISLGIADAIIFPDADKPGIKYAAMVAFKLHANGIPVFVADTKALGWKDGMDAADHPHMTPEDYTDYLLSFPDWYAKQDKLEVGCAVMEVYASLDKIGLAPIRKITMALLGMNAKDFDLITGQFNNVVDEVQPTNILFEDVEEWPEPVNLADVLDELVELIIRFIILTPEQADVVAVWVFLTWVVEVLKVLPMIFIDAPEKDCGKTQLLAIIENVCRKPLMASNISPAAVFRVIEAFSPTLLVDEADSFVNPESDMFNILNSGHLRKSAYIVRNIGEDHTPYKFSTFGPKVVAGKNLGEHFPDTTVSRSFTIGLRRKLQDEVVDSLLDVDEVEVFSEIKSKLAKVATDNMQNVKDFKPVRPEGLFNRNWDNWRSMYSIASLAGKGWPKRISDAASYLSGGADYTPVSIGCELLTDIRKVIHTNAAKLWTTTDGLFIPVKILINTLCADKELPWATKNRGARITPHWLASKLKPYKLKPTLHRGKGPDERGRGYLVDQFEEVFSRYLPRIKSEEE